VTRIVVAPSFPCGAVTTICVDVREIMVAAIPPKVTEAPAPLVAKPVPEIVTESPEISPIDDGLIVEIVGATDVAEGVVKEAVEP
jgi:hypothetical protein